MADFIGQLTKETNTRDPQASLGYSDSCISCKDCPTHRPLSSAMRSNDDIHWPVHSLMLSFHDFRGLPLRRLPSTVPGSMIYGSVSWRQTRPNYDNLRCLTVDSKSSWRRVRILACCHTYLFCFMLSVQYANKRSSVAFVFLISLQDIKMRCELEIMDIRTALPLSFERNVRHFHLLTQRLSLHRTTTWWLHSAGSRCCIHLRLAIGHHTRHDRTLYWSRWYYEGAPFDVPSD